MKRQVLNQLNKHIDTVFDRKVVVIDKILYIKECDAKAEMRKLITLIEKLCSSSTQ